ncbi:Succinate dehydrogenase assembly factor 1 [Picochlorum sp. SENEW3]|nr:Succinate dehydrogenase assembly factor 1 [Picochlorum sp. SENEW3]
MGLQRQVLSLYRQALRVSREKGGEPVARIVRKEFEEFRHVDRKNFSRIEYLLRKGSKQLETLKMSSVKKITTDAS